MKTEIPVISHPFSRETFESRCDSIKCLSITSFVVALVSLIAGVLILAKVGAFNSIGSGWGGGLVGFALPLVIISNLITKIQKKSEVHKNATNVENTSSQVDEPYTLDLCRGEKDHDTIHGPAVINWQKAQWDALVTKASQIQHLCITLGDSAAWRGLVNHMYLLKGLKVLHINDISKEFDKSSIDDLAKLVEQRKISVRISCCHTVYNNSADYASSKGNWYGPNGRGTSDYACGRGHENHGHQIAKYPRIS